MSAFALTGRSHVLRVAASALGCALLTGCQSIESTSANTPQVRLVMASPEAAGLDFYMGTAALAYGLGPSTQTNYIPVSALSGPLNAMRPNTAQVLASAAAEPHPGERRTIVAGSTLAGLQLTVLTDASAPAPAGEIGVRVLDQRTTPGAVDVYFVPGGGRLMTSTAVAAGLTFGSNTGYLPLAAGTYRLEVLPAGTVAAASTLAAYSGASVTYATGSMQTFVLTSQPDGGVGVIAVTDFPVM